MLHVPIYTYSIISPQDGSEAVGQETYCLHATAAEGNGLA